MSHRATDGAAGPARGADAGRSGPPAALEATLAAQVGAARRGDLDAVAAGAERLDALLAEGAASAALLPPDRRRRLRRLHDELRLILVQQRDELARLQTRVGRGKGSLKAYRDGGRL